MKKNKLINLLYIYILIQPFIDLATSLVIRFTDNFVTLGIIIRGIFLIVVTIYLLFYNKSKYRKFNILYLSLIVGYVLCYFITKDSVFDLKFFFTEVKYIFKHIYVPILFIGLLNFFEINKFKFKEMNDVFVKVITIYSILIIIPIITFTSFSSYQTGEEVGLIGWFYSANEIGAILTILFPFLLYYITKKNTYKSGLLLLPTTFAMITLGTKTSLLGILILLVLLIIYFVVQMLRKKEYYLKPLVMSIILLVLVSSSIFYVPAVKNVQENIPKHNNPTSFILSNRDTYLLDTAKIYEQSSIDEKLFGIGITNRSDINNKKIEKAIEMDIYDIIFRFGIFGTIILLLPYLYLYYVIVKYFKDKNKVKLEQLIYAYAVGIALMIAYMAGHVLGAPAVSIYLVISMIMLIKSLEVNSN